MAGWRNLACAGMLVLQAGPAMAACRDATPACLESAAKSYLDGLATHDGTQVQFAPQVTIFEHGRTTRMSEAEARAYVDHQVPMRGYRNARYVANSGPKGGQVVQLVVIDISFGDADAARMKTTPGDHTLYVANAFRIEQGLIREIDTRFNLNAASPSFGR